MDVVQEYLHELKREIEELQEAEKVYEHLMDVAANELVQAHAMTSMDVGPLKTIQLRQALEVEVTKLSALLESIQTARNSVSQEHVVQAVATALKQGSGMAYICRKSKNECRMGTCLRNIDRNMKEAAQKHAQRRGRMTAVETEQPLAQDIHEGFLRSQRSGNGDGGLQRAEDKELDNGQDSDEDATATKQARTGTVQTAVCYLPVMKPLKGNCWYWIFL